MHSGNSTDKTTAGVQRVWTRLASGCKSSVLVFPALLHYTCTACVWRTIKVLALQRQHIGGMVFLLFAVCWWIKKGFGPVQAPGIIVPWWFVICWFRCSMCIICLFTWYAFPLILFLHFLNFFVCENRPTLFPGRGCKRSPKLGFFSCFSLFYVILFLCFWCVIICVLLA